MRLEYVPLLTVQRELHEIPRHVMLNGAPKRFLEYLRIMTNPDGTLNLPPLVGINPMAKDHVTRLLDDLLALDADTVAARTLNEVSTLLADAPGRCKVTLLVMDDWMGAWTNRSFFEFDIRFPGGVPDRLPRWTRDYWLTAVLWSSEPATIRAIREAILTMVHRLSYVTKNGPAQTLREMLDQEGYVMALAGCEQPELEPEDLAYTREAIAPHLDATDKRTQMECLFGDASARSLGFTPRGLSPWAGLALARADCRHDSRLECSAAERRV